MRLPVLILSVGFALAAAELAYSRELFRSMQASLASGFTFGNGRLPGLQ